MRFLRLPVKDPRTVARDIPGISEILFPGLVPGVVAYLNRTSIKINKVEEISKKILGNVSLNAAMLYEIAYVIAEKRLDNRIVTNDECIELAIKRQSRFFDAVKPDFISSEDIKAIESVADNLVISMKTLAGHSPIEIAPRIAGLEWVASSEGDFAFQDTLVEVKCSGHFFSANDYRQLLIYWLLQITYVLETNTSTWKRGILLNPRLNKVVSFEFEVLHKLVAGGRDVIETVELFQSVISSARSKI